MSVDNNVTIYACGGCGINLGSKFSNFEPKLGYAEIRVVYLDSSYSNFPKDATDDQCKIMCENEGSGKVRAHNVKEIAKNVPDVLATHSPSAFNIVVYSGGGGTGAVIGTLLSRELNRKDVPHVNIMVGDNESHVSAENTYKAFKSLESISLAMKLPVILSWHKNSTETPRTVVDKNVYKEILYLAKAASGKNRDLDPRDVANWVYYTRPRPELPAQISMLTITSDIGAASQIKNPISVIHLLKGENSLPKEFAPPLYGCTGYLPDTQDEKETNLIFAISTDEIPALAKSIEADYVAYEERAKALSKINPTLISDADVLSEEGLIL